MQTSVRDEHFRRRPVGRIGPAFVPWSAVSKGVVMTPIETDVTEYLLWMQIHNYARTTIAGRARYLGYLSCFLAKRGIKFSEEVTLEDLLTYQHALYSYRKSDGLPLTVATQAQRLVPVAHFFSWLRRSGRINVNPAADMTMPSAFSCSATQNEYANRWADGRAASAQNTSCSRCLFITHISRPLPPPWGYRQVLHSAWAGRPLDRLRAYSSWQGQRVGHPGLPQPRIVPMWLPAQAKEPALRTVSPLPPMRRGPRL
jgi:hypothetical protein